MSDAVQTLLATVGATLFQRGWLSSNNVLFVDSQHSALVDSGYGAHAEQTLRLIQHALAGRPLHRLLNTHLHSDHCGGNALLQQAYPDMVTWIPPGEATAVAEWDEDALTYKPTGQECPRFHFDALLRPGDTVRLGRFNWEIHAAKGHDPHAVILFQPEQQILISADALWQNGFGVVFPELEGIDAFAEVRETLQIIEKLSPRLVIPGHGPAFADLDSALKRAEKRLNQFLNAPEQHRRYAQKVLFKFRILEWQQIKEDHLLHWALQTPYIRQWIPLDDPVLSHEWLDRLLNELASSGAIRREAGTVFNA